MSKTVPEEWAIRTLSDLASIDNKSLKNNTDPDYRFRYIDIASVKTAKVDIPTEYVSFGESPSRARKCVRKGDVLMSTVRPNLKGFAYFDVQGDDFVVSTGFAVLTANKMSDSNFLYQSILSDNVTRQIESLVAGSNYPAISSANVRSLEVLAPPLPEQQKIATILSSVDDVIEKTRSQIDKLKDLKTGMMQELLTKGIGHTEFKDSPVGFIPINWEVKQIGEMVVKVGSGITPRGGSASYVDVGIPLIRSQNVHSDGLRLDNVSYITKTQHAKMSGSQLKPCDVLLNITGASIGRCYYLPSDFKEGNVNQHVCIIRLKQKILDSVFLTFCLNSESGQRQIMSLQAGGNREGLNFQQVRAIRLPVPPLDEQKKIAEIVSSIEKNICNKLAKLAHMSDTKKALMQDLLTGKVRVTPNESAAL